MSKFIMLVGLPASGKSTLTQELSVKYNAKILCSDELREELYGDVDHQDNNSDLFEEMNRRTNEFLLNSENVIYDATNINRKRRVHLINYVIKADEKIVYYLNNSIKTITYRNEKRNRNVPEYVLDKMYKNLHIPVENEGWCKVIYTEYTNKHLARFRELYEQFLLDGNNHDELFENLMVFITEFRDIFNLPQDSSYHSFSVSRHTYHVYKYIFDNYQNEDKLIMLWTSVFHDIGKAFCKSFKNFKGEETKYANFIGHEYVSSQVAASYLDLFGYDEQFIKQVVTLIQFHMMPMKASEKKMKEVGKIIGENLFEKLMILHDADTKAK